MIEKRVFSTYHSKRAFDDIAHEIKKSILSKKFEIGDRLPSERSLAEQFGVGRLTIREAMRTLETRGIVKVKKGCEGGAIVGNADPEIITSIIMDNMILEGLTGDQMIEARIGLQTVIIESTIKNATTEDLEIIREHIEKATIVKDPDEENAKEIVIGMIDFHCKLAEASHNLPYIVFTRTLLEWARRRLKNWLPTEEAQKYCKKSHKKIYEAIKNKKMKLSQRLIKDHIVHMGELVSDYIER